MKVLLLAIFTSFFGSGIYTIQFNDITGQEHRFNSLRGKKILIVNIATGGDKAGQIGELQKLQALYADSLTVVAFPSNSFGNEQHSNQRIKQICDSLYHATFILAEKGSVKGGDIQEVYSWLTDKNKNGCSDLLIKDDFQKYLLDEEGEIVGIFSPLVSPLDPSIRAAIQKTSH